MKIEFDSKTEKEVLYHIITEWLIATKEDVMGCEPSCRDESSPGCWHCIQEWIKEDLDEGELYGLDHKWYLSLTIKEKEEVESYGADS